MAARPSAPKKPEFRPDRIVPAVLVDYLKQGIPHNVIEVQMCGEVYARQRKSHGPACKGDVIRVAHVVSYMPLGNDRWLVAFYLPNWNRVRSEFIVAYYDGLNMQTIYGADDEIPILVPATEYHPRTVVDVGFAPARRGANKIECDWFKLTSYTRDSVYVDYRTPPR